MVDIARPATVAKKKKIRRMVYGAAVLVVLVFISVGISRLKPAAPSVDKAAVWVDTVKRGPMLRLVRGSGTLVPEDIRWVNTSTQGRVERILLRPGAMVTAGTVILELSNPELQQSVTEGQLSYQSAQASYQNRKAELESQLLSQQSDVAGIEANYKDAALQLEAQEKLYKDGLVSEIQVKQSRSREAELKNRLKLAEQRLTMQRAGIRSQLAPQAAAVDQNRAQYQLRVSQLENLRVKSTMSGVLQQVPVEVGQPTPSPPACRVADESACVKRSKARGKNSGEMPCPLSCTVSRASSPDACTATSIAPPRGVNLIALAIKCQAICRSRVGSP